jgi:hypothetical protein
VRQGRVERICSNKDVGGNVGSCDFTRVQAGKHGRRSHRLSYQTYSPRMFDSFCMSRPRDTGIIGTTGTPIGSFIPWFSRTVSKLDTRFTSCWIMIPLHRMGFTRKLGSDSRFHCSGAHPCGLLTRRCHLPAECSSFTVSGSRQSGSTEDPKIRNIVSAVQNSKQVRHLVNDVCEMWRFDVKINIV